MCSVKSIKECTRLDITTPANIFIKMKRSWACQTRWVKRTGKLSIATLREWVLRLWTMFKNFISWNFFQLDMKEVLRNYTLGVRKFILNIKDEDSLDFRRGLLTIYWHCDLLARLILYAVIIGIIALTLFFIFDPETFCNFFHDIFNTLKFFVSHKLVLSQDVIEKCNQN